eukprot:1160045-Pelagomonas_calceolata.AAC.8
MELVLHSLDGLCEKGGVPMQGLVQAAIILQQGHTTSCIQSVRQQREFVLQSLDGLCEKGEVTVQGLVQAAIILQHRCASS